MPNLQTRKLGGLFRGLFVGDPGTGKTIAAGSFPGPIKIYDFDDRVEPLLNFYANRDDIDYITVVSSKSERRDTIDFMEFCQEFMDLQERCPWETIVIDSLTSLSACCVMYALGINGEFNLKKGKLPRPGFDEFKGETATVLKILEVCKSLPAHVIATAHPIRKIEMTRAGDMESMRTVHSLTGYGTKTPSFVPVYFNELYLFTAEAGARGMHPKRWVSTVATEEIGAKTALPLPPVFEVTNAKLYSVIQKFLEAHQLKLETKRKEREQQKGVEAPTT